MQKNNKTESKIDKRIEELQNDISYSWKQTSEIIDIIYRTAVADLTDGICEKFTSVKPENNVKNEIPKWKKIEKPVQNDKETSSVIKSLKAELEKVKNENKKLSDELKDINSLNDTPSFRSGQLSALKFALLTLDENDRVDSFNILKDKYSTLQLTLKIDEHTNKSKNWA